MEYRDIVCIVLDILIWIPVLYITIQTVMLSIHYVKDDPLELYIFILPEICDERTPYCVVLLVTLLLAVLCLLISGLWPILLLIPVIPIVYCILRIIRYFIRRKNKGKIKQYNRRLS